MYTNKEEGGDVPFTRMPDKIQDSEKSAGLFPKFRRMDGVRESWLYFVPPKTPKPIQNPLVYKELAKIAQSEPIIKLLMAKLSMKPLSIDKD